MADVYLLYGARDEFGVEYRYRRVLAVYSSWELAAAAKEKWEQSNVTDWDSYFIQPWQVQDKLNR